MNEDNKRENEDNKRIIIIQQDGNRKVETKKNNIWYIVIVACICVVVLAAMCSALFPSCGAGSDSGKYDSSVSTYYLERYSKSYIQEYALYPSTVEITDINYYTVTHKGEEMYKTSGTFKAESKLGLKVNNSFNVYIRYKYGEYTKVKVVIDGTTYYAE